MCVAKTLQLLDDKNVEESCSEYLELAASQNSGIASYMQWAQMKANLPVSRSLHVFSSSADRDSFYSDCCRKQSDIGITFYQNGFVLTLTILSLCSKPLAQFLNH